MAVKVAEVPYHRTSKLVLTTEKHFIPWYEDILENDHVGKLAIFHVTEVTVLECPCLKCAATIDMYHSFGIYGNSEGHSIVFVGFQHLTGRDDETPVGTQ